MEFDPQRLTPIQKILLYGRGAQFLLNQVPGAAAAYSTRIIHSSFLNQWVWQIRRDNDDDEVQVLTDLSGDEPEITLDSPLIGSAATLGDFVGANSGFLANWRDQSGNGRDATQTTTGNQPRIVHEGVLEADGTKPAVRFIRANSTRMSVELPATNEWSFASVCSVTGAGGGGHNIFGSGTASGNFQLLHATAVNRLVLRTLINNDTVLSLATPWNQSCVSSLIEEAGKIALRRNAQSTSNTNHEEEFESDTFSIGSRGTSDTMDGRVSEIIYFSDRSYIEDISAIEANQAAHFGITLAS